MADEVEHDGNEQPGNHRVAGKPGDGAQRVRPFEHERPPPVPRKGFRQHHEPVNHVGQGQPRGGKERQPHVHLAEQPANGRAEHEPHTPGRSDQAEAGSPLLVGRDVGHVGVGGGESRRRHARDHAAEKQPHEAGRQPHDHVVDAERGQGDQQNGPATEAVRKVSDHRREEKLHDREDEHQKTAVAGRFADGGIPEFGDQLRQHRDDDAERNRVREDGDEDEQQRVPSRRARDHAIMSRAGTPTPAGTSG